MINYILHFSGSMLLMIATVFIYRCGPIIIIPFAFGVVWEIAQLDTIRDLNNYKWIEVLRNNWKDTLLDLLCNIGGIVAGLFILYILMMWIGNW